MSEKESTLSLETIAEWLDDHYNDALSTYVWENKVRLTNGSAAHFVDIYIADGQSLALEGERYGETIAKSCDATEDSLIDTLSKTI
jgi:hypothetical protein